MTQELIPVSIIVHTKNSAATLKRCLESVSFATEIVVIDMQSTDDSKKIAKEHLANIYDVEDSGFVETVRNFGIGKASQDWVFILDADEEVSEGLHEWLKKFFDNDNEQDVSAFFIPRRNFMFGQEIQHTGWWPDYQLRFFKKGHVTWQKEIHSQPKIVGIVEHLDADRALAIVHHNYKDVTQFVERMNRYTSITAKQSILNIPLSPADLISAFNDEFVKRMFKWEGYKDGGLGLSLALLQANYQLLVQMKQWEKNNFAEKNGSERATVEAVNEFKKDLAYWIADWNIKNSSGITKLVWMIKRKLRR